ncbi:hypothetical protein WPG_0223 [Winogradskyella sp. PG-2]|nr:hypothetical protein [Winogradskyella sp. PG-2]BAO74453.1 hypothetical protein WPG_0223 [Winogradskyella sp. PG-2]
MNEDIKNEAIEQLEKDIHFGFYNSIDLLETISDMFYDVEDFDKVWFQNEIDTRLEQHEAESQHWEQLTDFQKLVNAFDDLNKKGVVSLHKAGYTRQDGEGDCMEVIEELESLGIKTKGYCYYHSQDLERAIGDKKM